MRLINNVRLISRVYGISVTNEVFTDFMVVIQSSVEFTKAFKPENINEIQYNYNDQMPSSKQFIFLVIMNNLFNARRMCVRVTVYLLCV